LESRIGAETKTRHKRGTKFMLYSGIAPGYDSATGFPVRSHHLSGLWGGTAVKGELLHHNQQINYTAIRMLLSIGTAQRGRARPLALAL
jgi:hypothetical protein